MDGFSRVMLKGATAGMLADIQGGSFTAGFSLGIFTAASTEAYRWVTSYDRPNPWPARNEPYTEKPGEPLPQGVNVSAFSDPGVCTVGGTCSRILNAIPIFNSGALAHDSIFVYRELMPFNTFTNVECRDNAGGGADNYGCTCGRAPYGASKQNVALRYRRTRAVKRVARP